MDRTAQFYSQPTYARGGFMPVFAGSRRQRGGNVLGALKSFFMPFLRMVGRKGAQQAIGLASDVVGDVTSGKSIKNSIRQRGISHANRLGRDLLSTAVGQLQPTVTSKAKATPIRSRKRRVTTKAKQSAKRHKPNF